MSRGGAVSELVSVVKKAVSVGKIGRQSGRQAG